jgi:hypothetical protein
MVSAIDYKLNIVWQVFYIVHTNRAEWFFAAPWQMFGSQNQGGISWPRSSAAS